MEDKYKVAKLEIWEKTEKENPIKITRFQTGMKEEDVHW